MHHYGESITPEETATVSSARLKRETECLRKLSFALLSGFDMDRQKEEEERGVTTVHTQEQFCTDKRKYTVIIAPGQGHDQEHAAGGRAIHHGHS